MVNQIPLIARSIILDAPFPHPLDSIVYEVQGVFGTFVHTHKLMLVRVRANVRVNLGDVGNI